MECTARLTLLHLSRILIHPPSLLHFMMSRVGPSQDRRTKNARAPPAPPQEEGPPQNPRLYPIMPSCAFSSPTPMPKPNNLPDHSPNSIYVGRRSPSPSDESSRSRSPSTDRSSVRSSLGEESQDYEPHAPRERSESRAAWPCHWACSMACPLPHASHRCPCSRPCLL